MEWWKLTADRVTRKTDPSLFVLRLSSPFHGIPLLRPRTRSQYSPFGFGVPYNTRNTHGQMSTAKSVSKKRKRDAASEAHFELSKAQVGRLGPLLGAHAFKCFSTLWHPPTSFQSVIRLCRPRYLPRSSATQEKSPKLLRLTEAKLKKTFLLSASPPASSSCRIKMKRDELQIPAVGEYPNALDLQSSLSKRLDTLLLFATRALE